MAITKQAILIGTGATVVAGGGYGAFYLSQDKTIRDRLISSGETLIENDGEYEIAYIERRGDKDFATVINGINIKAEASVGGASLKGWCEKHLSFDLSKQNIENILPNVKKYCTKPSSTIEERITKLGKKLIEKTDWKKKLELIKSANTDVESLKADLSLSSLDETSSESTAVEKAFKDWCEKAIKTSLANDKEETTWKKVEGRCLQQG